MRPKQQSWMLVLLLLFLCIGGRAQGQSVLVNPAFQAEPPQQGWEVTVYGASPQIARDTRVPHAGRSSLRISADTPSDTALGQEITLKAGRCYRLRGWVKTHALDPHGAPVAGTLQVQFPGGRGILASGSSHTGDTDWTEVNVPFLAPSEGRVRICIFFVGFGRGTGVAWFNSLRLEEVDLHMSPVTITREPLCPGEISPLQYGQFMESLCDLIPSMWAEKLYDGSFEGLKPYKFVYLKETDFKEKPWYPSGMTNRAEYSHDATTHISGAVSQKIAVPSGAPCTVGISQDGIAVEQGQACRFSCYLKQEGISGPVQITLHHEGKVYATAEFRPTGAWQKYQVQIAAAETDTDATLSIAYRGPGTLWLDNASLMPLDTVGGWRKDVFEALRALKPGIVRYGGSTLDDANLGDFKWRDTIGDPDRRPPFTAWGGLQPTGPGLEEIVQFIQAVGAEPLICVRFEKSSPEEAAAEVEYFNGSVDTPMGAMRAKNGHPQPYHIRYWQVGNERGGAAYETALASFCKAMRAIDPTIKLMSSFPSPTVLRNAADAIDYTCPHQYNIYDMSGTEAELNRVREMIQTNAPGRHIHVGVTEWNTTAGDAGPRRAMLWTLDNALACARYHNLLHRNCDLVEIANRSNLTNSFCSGIIQTDRSRLYKTPTYYMQQLYATLAGNRPLALRSDLPAQLGTDLSATLSADGKTLTLFVVNESGDAIERPLDLSAFGAEGQNAEIWTLEDTRHAGEPDVTNSFADPERVVPVHTTFQAASAKFTYRFPPYSLTVLRWKVP